MHGVEGALDAGAVLTHEETQRQIDGYGVLLADVAHVRCPFHDDGARFGRCAGDRLPPLLLELPVHFLHCIKARVLEAGEPGAHEIVAQIGEQHPEG